MARPHGQHVAVDPPERLEIVARRRLDQLAHASRPMVLVPRPGERIREVLGSRPVVGGRDPAARRIDDVRHPVGRDQPGPLVVGVRAVAVAALGALADRHRARRVVRDAAARLAEDEAERRCEPALDRRERLLDRTRPVQPELRRDPVAIELADPAQRDRALGRGGGRQDPIDDRAVLRQLHGDRDRVGAGHLDRLLALADDGVRRALEVQVAQGADVVRDAPRERPRAPEREPRAGRSARRPRRRTSRPTGGPRRTTRPTRRACADRSRPSRRRSPSATPRRPSCCCRRRPAR